LVLLREIDFFDDGSSDRDAAPGGVTLLALVVL
jgi:hypothetical protein